LPPIYARLEFREVSAGHSIRALADWKVTVSRKSRNANFDQTLQLLREHAFSVEPSAEVEGGTLVSKDGVGAVLTPQAAAEIKSPPPLLAVAPGVLLRGQVARLLDRGHQKFFSTPQCELPASASQLRSIHLFTEELKQLAGIADLYNQSLGTTSDLYHYDRLKGREKSGAEGEEAGH
jgi:hypothetical protein